MLFVKSEMSFYFRHNVWATAFFLKFLSGSAWWQSVLRPKHVALSKKGNGNIHPCKALRLCTGRTAHRGSRGIALPFHDHGTRREWGSASRPGYSLPPGKTRYPLYRMLGGPQGRSGQVRKISPPPGLDPRTVQPVDSRYTDWATRPTLHWVMLNCKN